MIINKMCFQCDKGKSCSQKLTLSYLVIYIFMYISCYILAGPAVGDDKITGAFTPSYSKVKISLDCH